MRYLAAAIFTLSLTYWSGALIFGFGWGGWIVALLVMLAASLVVGLVAPSHSILFGLAAVTCIEISVVLANARSSISHGDYKFWTVFWTRDFVPHVGMWCLFAGISLMATIPIRRARKRA